MSLGKTLLRHGLIEVGLFQAEGQQQSFRLQLQMLPAYPAVLAECTQQIAERLIEVDRLVCPADSVPLGLAVSLQTRIPLVYSRGKGEAPVQDWVGAYDVGHPATLICHVMPNAETWTAWQKQLTSVGLNIVQVMALVELHPVTIDVPTHSILPLREWLKQGPELLPAGAVQAILRELER